MATDIAAKLDEARALIEKGWCCEDYKKVIGGTAHYCATGAIKQVGAGGAAMELLRKALGTHWIAEWNDEQKSKRPVVALFRKAADLARAEQSA